MSSRLDSFVKSIVFPHPNWSTYNTETRLDRLLHIPRVDAISQEENGTFTYGYLVTCKPSHHLVIYAHPNAVDIGMIYDEMHYISSHANVNILMFEYMGYGLTNAIITEESVNVDMLSAYLFAKKYLGVSPDRMVFCGRSIGAAPAARLCAALPIHETPSLLILQCPFSSLSECVHSISDNAVSIANFLGYNWFRTEDIVADIRCPVVLHHGTHDTVVPVSHSYTLKARRDKVDRPCVTYMYLEQGKGHNTLGRSQLIRIIHEKVVVDSFSQLDIIWPSLVVAHSPVYPLLFGETIDVLSMTNVTQFWKFEFLLRDFVCCREKLYVILTANVCVFAARCARAWQSYNHAVKNDLKTAKQPPGLWSRSSFIEHCVASWGNPLAIHSTTKHSDADALMVIFGCRVPLADCTSFEVPVDMTGDAQDILTTIMELPLLPALLRTIHRIVSSAPSMLSNDDLSRVLHPDLVDMVQTECERLVAFMPASSWDMLNTLITNFPKTYPTVVSAKALKVLQNEHVCTPLRRSSEGSFDELHEWARPWIEENIETVTSVACEMPWDYYLYKGRLLANTQQQSAYASAESWMLARKEGELVVALYRLFKKFSSQYIALPWEHVHS